MPREDGFALPAEVRRVVTWQADGGRCIDVSVQCERQIRGRCEWPLRDSRDWLFVAAYATQIGEPHVGLCGCPRCDSDRGAVATPPRQIVIWLDIDGTWVAAINLLGTVQQARYALDQEDGALRLWESSGHASAAIAAASAQAAIDRLFFTARASK